MKKKKKAKEEKIENKVSIINRSNILFVDIQVFLTFVVVILFIIGMFNKEFIYGVEIALFLALLCMAYNNYKIYKRKFATVLYLVFAVIILAFFILRLLGVL